MLRFTYSKIFYLLGAGVGVGPLYVGSLLGVAAEKPARRISGVGEKTVHAGLLHGWIENQLSLAVFVLHRVVVFDGHGAKGLAVGYQTIAKHGVVGGVRDGQQNQRCEERSYCERSGSDSRGTSLVAGLGAGMVFGFVEGIVAFERGHGLNYTRSRIGSGPEALTILHKKSAPELLSGTSNHGGDK